MVIVERELVVVQDPALPARAVKSLHPTLRSYDLVGSLLWGNLSYPPANFQDVPGVSVALDRPAVYPPYVGGSAIVVRIQQTTPVLILKYTLQARL
jgi:hypothetical protein